MLSSVKDEIQTFVADVFDVERDGLVVAVEVGEEHAKDGGVFQSGELDFEGSGLRAIGDVFDFD